MTAPAHNSETEVVASNRNANHKRRNIWLISLGALFLLIGLAWLLYWIFIGQFYIYTEDAYVHGNEVLLTPQVSAGVKAIYADETDLVEKGQLVVQLDPSNFLIDFEQAQQALASTVRDVVAMFQDVGAKEAEVALRTSELRQAKLDLKHREPLVDTGAVSVEQFEIYQTGVETAEAQLASAEQDLEMARAKVAGTTVQTHPLVEEKIWQIRTSYLNVIRTQVWAPATGYVAKRSVQVGDQVSAGDTLLYIIPLDDIWIEANYKETQLKEVRIGQSVEYTADLYGRGVKFHGKVVGFQPGSGSAFSLLPPENASGNWIKIIQRVPVRISVDPEEIRDHPLLLGLSMRTYVDVHDTDGKMLAKAATDTPLYTTTIYEKQMKELSEIDPLIEQIIEQNMNTENE